jgi:hypothetical protein
MGHPGNAPGGPPGWLLLIAEASARRRRHRCQGASSRHVLAPIRNAASM